MSGKKNRKLDQSEMEKVSGGTLNSYDAVYQCMNEDAKCYLRTFSLSFNERRACPYCGSGKIRPLLPET